MSSSLYIGHERNSPTFAGRATPEFAPPVALGSDRLRCTPRRPAASLLLGFDPVYGLAPGAVAGFTQHIVGHALAWRRGGVERAFVMESTAIAFYVLFALLLLATVVDSTGLVEVQFYWLAVAAMFVDTTVGSTRERRFV